ncbi:MAG: peptidyl-alpha-hydroxyglycine alpha-amidating lyase family protein [Planctomycetia bacterium]|nr:peptidyl-alpha-hydroxyglycine alpha-amidating lyase family protein [Planctomycetia bacterium]
MLTQSCREFGYTPDDHWAKLPPGFTWKEVAGVATDSRDRVFVFSRGEHPLLIFDPDGTFIEEWDGSMFVRPHGITISPDDCVYCTDDQGHTIRKFSPDGKLLFTLGTPGKPSDTGATSIDFRTIKHVGPPFHYPTNLAIAPGGDLFVSDGYGNARVHVFTPDGQLLFSWGEPGSGRGQFRIPHGIAIDREGTVYVADRENSRIELFSPKGEFIAEWINLARPCQVFIDRSGKFFVAELGYRAGMWPGTTAPTSDPTGGRISIFDAKRNLIARWGGGENPTEPGDFFAPHDICVDSRGDVYVAEVTWSAGGNRGLVTPGCHALQKFEANPARKGGG